MNYHLLNIIWQALLYVKLLEHTVFILTITLCKLASPVCIRKKVYLYVDVNYPKSPERKEWTWHLHSSLLNYKFFSFLNKELAIVLWILLVFFWHPSVCLRKLAFVKVNHWFPCSLASDWVQLVRVTIRWLRNWLQVLIVYHG